MEANEIRDRVQELCRIISESKEELKQLRSVCKHEHISESGWAHERPPNYCMAEVCDDCNQFIKETGIYPMPESTFCTFKYKPEQINKSYEEALKECVPGKQMKNLSMEGWWRPDLNSKEMFTESDKKRDDWIVIDVPNYKTE